jgi:hypothetical protein
MRILLALALLAPALGSGCVSAAVAERLERRFPVYAFEGAEQAWRGGADEIQVRFREHTSSARTFGNCSLFGLSTGIPEPLGPALVRYRVASGAARLEGFEPAGALAPPGGAAPLALDGDRVRLEGAAIEIPREAAVDPVLGRVAGALARPIALAADVALAPAYLLGFVALAAWDLGPF